MKKFGGLVLLLLLACSRGGVDLPKPSFHQLSNGIKIFALEDSTLPTFRLSLIQPAGSVWDPSGQAGVAALTAQLVRTGGTKTMTPVQIEAAIGKAGATLEMGVTREETRVGLKVLKGDRAGMLKLLGEMLRAPRFDSAAFLVVQRQALVALQKQKENPLALVERHFPSLVYGDDSSWARYPTEQSVSKLDVAKIGSFFTTHYRPERMIVAVAGDFRTQEILKELETALGLLVRQEEAPIVWPAVTPQPKGAGFIARPVEQAAIRLGHLGGLRENPDKFAALVANFILGGSGSLTSRLGLTIRSEQGQAYSVWSRYGFGFVPALFSMTAQTEASQLKEVAFAMQEILSRLQSEGATAEEVTDAKTAILRSLYFEYETRFKIVDDWARFEFRGYPRNYLNKFVRALRQVDVKTVNRVLREYFHPQQLSFLVVGPAGSQVPLRSIWPELRTITP